VIFGSVGCLRVVNGCVSEVFDPVTRCSEKAGYPTRAAAKILASLRV
jgi:hypothetical protein